jgi:hypothetical protein
MDVNLSANTLCYIPHFKRHQSISSLLSIIEEGLGYPSPF